MGSEGSAHSAARLSCRTRSGEFSTCGRCQSCVCTANLSGSAQWLLTAGEAAKRRFLTGILVRCRSVEILEKVQNVLRVTLGKDFTYARSHVKAVSQEEFRDCGCGMSVMDMWEWFSKSPNWTKSSYLLGVLSLCDTELLHMLGNLVSVLIAREKRGFPQFNTGKRPTPRSQRDRSCFLMHWKGKTSIFQIVWVMKWSPSHYSDSIHFLIALN
uniref:Uncharacterized protein n=1 Tax=Pygocentrus nattereri TaxID=42514 RepID=A0AAR2L096_PYGNA